MDDSCLEAVLQAVGPRLRNARKGRGLTLARVADRTGFSVSTLSRLESGTRRPSLDLLIPLSGIYRMPMDDLVGAPQVGDPRIHPRPIRRDGAIYLPLTRQTSGVHAFKMILPGRSPRLPIEQRAHDGVEWIYVLSGQARLKVGTEVTVLPAGGAAQFDTRMPHGIVSAGSEAVEVLGLFSRQGEHLHVQGR
ncbi:helix-turn-helix domain-containing protein [Streptomyces bluensis]|uniref:helix-turn-helix domain-containing protein n=1 Tax=Streptomyces bluensis TaxID=33897 RepID=UPI00332DDBC9